MESEGTGYVLLDRDNNLDGPIQNVNLTLREDENFVKNQIEFTNIPLFAKTLFIRPNLDDEKKCCKCHKCKKHRCKCKNKKELITTTSELEYMVSGIYDNAFYVLREYIPPAEGEAKIRAIVNDLNKYRKSNLIFSYIRNEDGDIFINMCCKYRLDSKNDCIVAFNMCTEEQNLDDSINKTLILKVSNSPVDEDMRDAVYPFIIPFGYQFASN